MQSDPAIPNGCARDDSETVSAGAAAQGQILTGKQEHCETTRSETCPIPASSSAIYSPLLFELLCCLLTAVLHADLKRELIARQVRSEINELNSPTALQRFGAPFRSEFGEVAPVDSELPILRYIFVHHVRNFPFLDQAKEKEFWQDKLQVVRSIKPSEA